MFSSCSNLNTIYVGDGWSTESVTSASYMFSGCTNLVGGMGTTYSSSNPTDTTYAHVDGGPDNPGYFTQAPSNIPGDANGDGQLDVDDVTVIIDRILGNNTLECVDANADSNGDRIIDINDVTDLINKLLGIAE
jgi:hypothetical protein